MRVRTIAAAVMAVALFAGGALMGTRPADANGPVPVDGMVLLTAQLSADAETGGGQDGASGVALVTLDLENDVACISLVSEGLDPLTAGHIHEGAAGVDGGVVVNFGLTGVDPDSCVAVASATLDEIAGDPAGHYVNLHNALAPAGAIRGQLGAPDAGAAQLVPLVTTMSGAEEVPGPGDGDGSGSAYLWVDRVGNEVCYSGSVEDIGAPTGAHIHTGALGVAGGVAVALDLDLSGCAAVDDSLADLLATSPEGYYLNVHTAEFPGGAVRGQLGVRGGAGETGWRRAVAPLRGNEEVDPGDPTGSGLAVLDLGPDGEVCFDITSDFLSDTPTAGHIHMAPAGVNGPVVLNLDLPTNGEDGCVTGTVDLVGNILASPGDYYVNLHSATYPAGALRGQVQALPQGIHGTVTDGGLPPMPVPDGWVQLHHVGVGDEGTYIDGVPTDPKGRYIQPGLTSGSHIASYRSDAFTAGYLVDVLPGQLVQLDIDFGDVAYLEGRVVDIPDGTGLGGMHVCIDSMLPPLPYDEPGEPTDCADEAPDVTTEPDGTWWVAVTPGLWGVRTGDPAGLAEADVASPEVASLPVGATGGVADLPVYRCDGDRFSDVGESHVFCLPISWMAVTGLSTGYSDGTYRPAAGLTRQTLAAFFWRRAGEPEPAPDAPEFSDVPESSPFHDAISWMAGEGITTGRPDGSFGATDPVTRQAMAAFFYRLAGSPDVEPTTVSPFADVPPTNPFFDAILWMHDTGLSTGIPGPGDPPTLLFAPVEELGRGGFSAFLYRAVRAEGIID